MEVPSERPKGVAMEVVFTRCAGLDVHSKTVVVCRRIIGPDGKLDKQVRTFGTTTGELRELAGWLSEESVTHVAMESTGVFWKPVWNILEERFTILLVNARHVKQVPGHKTDVKDCEWIAQLLQHGLLRGSFVPPRPIRELRDLTRHRAKLADQRTAIANRIHKTLEDANIKLGTVATDILGVSGRAMLEAIVAGEDDHEALADLARKRLRAKIPALREALDGRVTEHHRFLLKTLLGQLRFFEAQIVLLDERIAEKSRPFEAALDRLDTIPGIARRCAENLLAEIGPDMSAFPSAAHLASWGAMCPGNDESAGKRRTGRTAKGNRWLRRALIEAAWGATRAKNTYLSAQYRRLAARRGKKRAIVAVGHSILVAAYHVLAHSSPHHELGADHFSRLDPQRLTRHLVRRLEHLGHKVTLEPVAPVAA
jgi:transposase